MKNEPGFYESCCENIHILNYNKYVMLKNFDVAVNDILNRKLECPTLKKIINNHVINNKQWYISTLNSLINRYEGKNIETTYFSPELVTTIKFKPIKTKLIKYLKTCDSNSLFPTFSNTEKYSDNEFILKPLQRLRFLNLNIAMDIKNFNSFFDDKDKLIISKAHNKTKFVWIKICNFFGLKGYTKFNKKNLINYIYDNNEIIKPIR